MHYLRTPIALAFSLLLFAPMTCVHESQAGDNAYRDEPVKLVSALRHMRCMESSYPGTCSLFGVTFTGYIEVANIAYEKSIAVRHAIGYAGEWTDLAASYVGPSTENHEYWRFETAEYSYHPRLGVDIRFAIQYTVDGAEYWDNNNDSNYCISVGPRTFYGCAEGALGTGKASLLEAHLTQWEDQNPVFRGTVLLANLSYEKSVRIVYSTDAWETAQETYAQFGRQHDSGEQWFFQVELGQDADQVEFAVDYQSDGTEYWDNNLGDNYTLDLGQHIGFDTATMN